MDDGDYVPGVPFAWQVDLIGRAWGIPDGGFTQKLCTAADRLPAAATQKIYKSVTTATGRLSENLRVELPKSIVECSRKADPHQIRDEEHPREWTHAPKSNHRGDNKNPKQYDLSKCQSAEFPGEKEPTPKGVQYELKDKQGERDSIGAELSGAPHQPCSDRH